MHRIFRLSLVIVFCCALASAMPVLLSQQATPSSPPASMPQNPPASPVAPAPPTPSTLSAPATPPSAPTPPTPGAAQAPTATPVAPPANPDDVKTIESIMAAVYDVISGPAGKARDWNRMRSLFIPGARLIATGKRPDGSVRNRVMTVDDYVSLSGPMLEKNGFFEKEAASRTEQFGHIAHVFSTYESRHSATDPKPFQRGINSFQLWNDGTRWWVVTIYWEGERDDNPIPEKYLKSVK